jgi:hypothetical protein
VGYQTTSKSTAAEQAEVFRLRQAGLSIRAIALEVFDNAPLPRSRRADLAKADIQSKVMEHLWSQADAAGGKRAQIQTSTQYALSLQTAATACHQLRSRAHGKEGVCGSSPQEGLKLSPA